MVRKVIRHCTLIRWVVIKPSNSTQASVTRPKFNRCFSARLYSCLNLSQRLFLCTDELFTVSIRSLFFGSLKCLVFKLTTLMLPSCPRITNLSQQRPTSRRTAEIQAVMKIMTWSHQSFKMMFFFHFRPTSRWDHLASSAKKLQKIVKKWTWSEVFKLVCWFFLPLPQHQSIAKQLPKVRVTNFNSMFIWKLIICIIQRFKAVLYCM